jgi:hypothetical protein
MRKTASRHSLPHTLSAPAVLLSVVRILSSIPAAEAVEYLLPNRHRSTNGASNNPIRKAGIRHILYVIEANNSLLFIPL